MITSYQLAYYSDSGGGERIVNFTGPPRTQDIAGYRLPTDQFVVQLIGKVFEVYDLQTLKSYFRGSTIGVPVAYHQDYDVAVMTAILTQGE